MVTGGMDNVKGPIGKPVDLNKAMSGSLSGTVKDVVGKIDTGPFTSAGGYVNAVIQLVARGKKGDSNEAQQILLANKEAREAIKTMLKNNDKKFASLTQDQKLELRMWIAVADMMEARDEKLNIKLKSPVDQMIQESLKNDKPADQGVNRGLGSRPDINDLPDMPKNK